MKAFNRDPDLNCDDIRAICKDYQELIRLKGELIIDTYEEMFKELLNITREGYFIGGNDAKREEYRATIARAKATLGDIRRCRQRDKEQGAGAKISDWFKCFRRHDMGASQEGDPDSGGADINGEERASDALPI